MGTVVIEVPGHVNGSGLSALGLVRGRRRVPCFVFVFLFVVFIVFFSLFFVRILSFLLVALISVWSISIAVLCWFCWSEFCFILVIYPCHVPILF